MKTRKLLFALALPALFAACTNDDFMENPTVANGEGELITLPEGWAVGVNYESDADTRVSWTQEGTTMRYSWLPIVKGRGEKAVSENIGFAEIQGSKVRTNYKFTVAGYLKKGQSKPEMKVCGENAVITNGYMLNKYAEKQYSLSEYDASNHTDYKKKSDYSLKYIAGGTKVTIGGEETVSLSKWEVMKDGTTSLGNIFDPNKLPEDAPNVRAGIFTTENSTIFAGEYLVYAPYDPAFAESTYLPATSDVRFVQNMKDNEVEHLSGKTFAIGKGKIEKGGTMAGSFSTRNLSAVIKLKVKLNKDATPTKNIVVKQVTLYDDNADAPGFLTKVGLDASKVGAVNAGTELYVAGTEEYAPTLVLKTEDAVALTKDARQTFAFAALPIAPKSLVAYIMIDDNGNCVKKALKADKNGKTSWTGGQVSTYEIEITDNDLDNLVCPAVDENTFRILTGHTGDLANAVNAKKPTTVEVLGKITLTKPAVIRGNYTIVGKKNASIVVAANDEWTNPQSKKFKENNRLIVHKGSELEGQAAKDAVIPAHVPVIDVPVVVEAAGCCKYYGGRLVVGNAVLKNSIRIEGDENGVAPAVVENGKAKGSTADGWLTMDVAGAKTTIESKASIVNEGQMNIGFYDNGQKQIDNSSEVNGPSVITCYGSITNKKNLVINRTLKEAVAESSTEKECDAKLYVDKTGSLQNDGTMTIEGVLTHYGSGKNTGVINDRVSSQVFGELLAYNAEGAEYICDVNDPSARFKDAVEGPSKPTTTVRFVERGGTYDFGTVDETKKATIKKYIVAVPDKENDKQIVKFVDQKIDLTTKDLVVETGKLTFAADELKDEKGNPKWVVTELNVKNLSVEAGAEMELVSAKVNVAKEMSITGITAMKQKGNGGYELNVGSAANDGKLQVNPLMNGTTPVTNFILENYSVATVNGSIVNNGRVEVKQASQEDEAVAAYLYYTVDVTAGAANWVKGGATRK